MRTTLLAALCLSCSLVLACGKSGSSAGAGGSSGNTAGVGAGGNGNGSDGGGYTPQRDGGGDTAADGAAGGGSGSGGKAGSGGGGTAGSNNPPIKVPAKIADLAAQLAGAICGALLDCVGQSKLDLLVGGEDCKTRVTQELSSGDLAHLQEAIDSGSVNYDATKLGPCLAGIKALGCKIQTDSFPTTCEAAVGGTVALGGACKINDECKGDAFCQMTGCPSHCAALLKKGDACTKDEECGDKLLCTSGMCQTPSYEGEDCAGTTGKVCAMGWSCWDSSDTKMGKCHSNAETLVGAKNATCTPGSTLCQEGLSCVYDTASLPTMGMFHCLPKVGSGTCYPGLPGQCPRDQFCDNGNPGDPRVAGKCSPLPGDGKPCYGNGVCAPTFVCVPEGQKAVCRPIHNNGGSCVINAQCRSGNCDAAVCEAPTICN